jgi:large subunit ribosomal protein L24
MKKEWSSKWVSSKQPRKQRKYRYNAPLHVRHKFISAHLSPELREKYGVRALPLRKGDEIEVMRGSSKGLRGTVERVDLKKCKIYVSGVKAKKIDGSEVMKALEPSNLKIVNLNLDDKKRIEVLNRARAGSETLEKKKTKKSYKEGSNIEKVGKEEKVKKTK